MSDQIGAVPIPTIAVSSTPWPISLPIEFGFINLTQPRVVVHQFGAGNAKREQRFYLGPNPRRWTLNFELSETQRDDLRNFWEVMNGPVTPFTIVLPKDNAGTTESVTVHFAAEPLVTDFGIGDVSKVTINLEEIYTGSGPTYPVNTTLQRFPDSTLATALTSQTQSLIPLVHIRPTAYQPGNPLDNIYLSDRRCTVGNQLYLPRLLAWDGISQTAVGVPGSSGSSDTVTFTFGNADRVMRKLADSVLLTAARVEFSVYHVQSGILLQLWAGQVLPGGFQFGVGPTFTLQCGDIISSPFCILPQKLIDRSCWIAYNNGLDCPFSTASTGMDFAHFPNADANDCDRGYDSDNGCLAHGMSPYYGGVIAVPQGIRIADNSTGFFGIGRNTISSVSLVSDSVYGQPIPIVFTDIEMPVKCLTVAGRNEGSGNGSFYEALVSW